MTQKVGWYSIWVFFNKNNTKMKIKQFEPRHFMSNEHFPVSFNHLINRFFSDDVNEVGKSTNFFRPSTDITEDENAYEVHLSLPGLKKKDIKIEVNNNELMISGEREHKRESNENKWHLSEISYGKFSRKFHLPDQVNTESITAEFEDGMLIVKIDKTEAQKPRLIDVK
jgi:HSP20 family protein